MSEALGAYLPSLYMTMRSIVDHWTAAYPSALAAMLRYPMGWVDETGNPKEYPAGKRIRPLLLLLCADATGGDWQHALPAAAAVEFLHNFSLVHDDIQDDSPTRHGRDTVWRVWGKPNAINAGDALFTISYATMSDLHRTDTPTPIALEAMSIFNRTNLELIRGQYLDMAFETQATVTVEEYISMIRGKSAALIAACAQLGSLIGSRDPQCASLYAEYGLALGLAFQIRDDILGVWGDPALTGKSAATDILTRKKTLPVLFGLAQDPELAKIYATSEISDVGVSTIIRMLEGIGALDYAKGQETRYYNQAMQALEQANPTGAAADALRGLSRQLLGRAY
ncbi:MAG: polyprenyl synthetase family protein [Chloroflexi bacterium]|nr:polyprenyl synthetase family protein [Chloroflexota bacterium]